MVYLKELERDVTTTEMASLWHHSFIEYDQFDFFTFKARIRAVMYMPCVKCSCSELKLAKILHTFFVLT